MFNTKKVLGNILGDRKSKNMVNFNKRKFHDEEGPITYYGDEVKEGTYDEDILYPKLKNLRKGRRVYVEDRYVKRIK